MELSLFLAELMGLYLVIMAVAFLVNQKMLQKVIDDYEKIPGFTLVFGGAVALIMGLLVVLTHNVWVSGWPVLVTILGWVTLIKGVSVLMFPSAMMGIAKKFHSAASRNGSLVIMLVVGLYLLAQVYL